MFVNSLSVSREPGNIIRIRKDWIIEGDLEELENLAVVEILKKESV